MAGRVLSSAIDAEPTNEGSPGRWPAGSIVAAFLGVLIVVGGVVFIGTYKPGPATTSTATPGAAAPAPGGAEPTPEAPAPNAAPSTGPLAVKPVVGAGSGDVPVLKVTNLVEGSGPVVQAGQTITVNYVGADYDTGVEFDSSWQRGQTFDTQIGTGKVIPGWDQGLVGVKVGSRVQLDIPADLAYGETPEAGAPAGNLRFVVDILAAA